MDFLIRKVSSDMLFVGKGREGVFDGNPGVIIAIGCVTDDRLRDSPPHGNRKHNTSVVFDC